ncbi:MULTISPECIES: hypothetical protein [unclassified Microcoleus]|uniref:hypothetical protein n=1 Tax=unclassified Microcoleus TaxID=2642155 RepID=UPI002FD4A70A
MNNRLFVDTLNRVQQVWLVELTLRFTLSNTITFRGLSTVSSQLSTVNCQQSTN